MVTSEDADNMFNEREVFDFTSLNLVGVSGDVGISYDCNKS